MIFPVTRSGEAPQALICLTRQLLSEMENRAHLRGVPLGRLISEAIVDCSHVPAAPWGSRDTVRVTLTPEAAKIVERAADSSNVIGAAIAAWLNPAAPVAEAATHRRSAVSADERAGLRIRPRFPHERLISVREALATRRGMTVADALAEGIHTFEGSKLDKAPPGPVNVIKGVDVETLATMRAFAARHEVRLSDVVLAVLEHWVREAKQRERRAR